MITLILNDKQADIIDTLVSDRIVHVESNLKRSWKDEDRKTIEEFLADLYEIQNTEYHETSQLTVDANTLLNDNQRLKEEIESIKKSLRDLLK